MPLKIKDKPLSKAERMKRYRDKLKTSFRDDILTVLEPPKLRNKREQFHFTNLELLQEKLKPNIVRFQ